MERAVSYMTIPAALSSIPSAAYVITKVKGRVLTGKRFTGLLMLFILSLLLTTTALRFQDNRYYSELDHPSELSCLSHLFTKSDHQLTVAGSWRTVIYCKYFDYTGERRLLMYEDIWQVIDKVIKDEEPELLLYLSQTINRSDILITGLRDNYILFDRLSQNQEIVRKIGDEIVTRKFNKVYTNEYYSLYSRPANG